MIEAKTSIIIPPPPKKNTHTHTKTAGYQGHLNRSNTTRVTDRDGRDQPHQCTIKLLIDIPTNIEEQNKNRQIVYFFRL